MKDFFGSIGAGLKTIFVDGTKGVVKGAQKGAEVTREIMEDKPTNPNIITPQNEQMNVRDMIKRERILRIIKHVILYSFLIIMAFFVIVPFYWMFLVSLKTTAG